MVFNFAPRFQGTVGTKKQHIIVVIRHRLKRSRVIRSLLYDIYNAIYRQRWNRTRFFSRWIFVKVRNCFFSWVMNNTTRDVWIMYSKDRNYIKRNKNKSKNILRKSLYLFIFACWIFKSRIKTLMPCTFGVKCTLLYNTTNHE